MATVKLEIDGKRVTAESDQTILGAARQNGIDTIPTLCDDGQLEPFTSCYLCVVSVKGAKSLVPACATKVAAGMVVQTNTPAIRGARKAALELILSNHYADCIGPCQLSCPAGVDIQGYLALAAIGKYEEAIRLIKEDNPLPAVCGRVCTRPCEVRGCRRNLLDQPVGIDFVKRYLADLDLGREDKFRMTAPATNGKRVAVVGAGPAGLSCAHYLALRGYSVDIYESLPEPGGMLRYGIPQYRLPKEVLDMEIGQILGLGVKLHTGRTLGKDFTIPSLKSDGYQAIFLGIGAWESTSMRVENEQSAGVLSGIDFLKSFGLQSKMEIHGTVLVVGGGNTAIDCARTALRCGAKEVKIVYRRSRKEMPANDVEIEDAEHEGVKFEMLTAPQKVVVKDGRAVGLECLRMELGEPDASGRRSPKPVKGSEFVIDCDFIIAAIGQGSGLTGYLNDKSRNFLPAGESLKLTKWNTIDVREHTFETSIDGVFSGGDVVTGAATAIEAIAAGRKSANAIDSWLTTGVAKPEPWEFNSRKDLFRKVTTEDLRPGNRDPRQDMHALPVDERIRGFAEVELGYTQDDVLHEAHRCLGCGCQALYDCMLRKYATEYRADVSSFLGEAKEYRIDMSHPLIELDPNKCILCGRCVRICSEVVGISAFGFINRGFNTVVKPVLGGSLLDTECVTCGLCIDTCPTGAIEEKTPLAKSGPWLTQPVESVCDYCGTGCTLAYDVFGDTLVKVSKSRDGAHTYGNLCSKGRFGYNYVQARDRLKTARVRSQGETTDMPLADGIRHAAGLLKSIAKRYSPSEIAVFVSPRLSNEEAYLAQKLARYGLGTHQVTTFTHLMNPQFNTPDVVSTISYDQLRAAGTVVVANSGTDDEHFVVDLLVKRALRNGGNLVYIGPAENRVSRFASVYIPCEDGQQVRVLQTISEAVRSAAASSQQFTGPHAELYRQAVSLLLATSRNALLFNKDYRGSRIPGDNRRFAAIASEMNLGILALREKANAQGLDDLGIDPAWMPGYGLTTDQAAVKAAAGGKKPPQPAPQNADIADLLRKQKIRAAIVIGEDPLGCETLAQPIKDGLRKADILIAADCFSTATTTAAEVVLPLSVIQETSGTITSHERRVLKFNRAVSPAAGEESWRILARLCNEIGCSTTYAGVDDVTAEILSTIPMYRGVKPGAPGDAAIWNIAEFRPARIERNGADTAHTVTPAATLALDHLETRFRRWFDGIFQSALNALHGAPVEITGIGNGRQSLEKLNEALGIKQS